MLPPYVGLLSMKRRARCAAEHMLDCRKTHLNIFHQIAFFFFFLNLISHLSSQTKRGCMCSMTTRLGSLSRIRAWRLEKAAPWSWVTGMNTERAQRGGEGFSFIINERCWDCFEDDFTRGNGGYSAISGPDLITLSPSAVLHYLWVSRSSHTPAVCERHANSEVQHTPLLVPPVFELRMELKFSKNKKKNKIDKAYEIHSRGSGGGGGGGISGCWGWGLRGGDGGWDERDVKSSKCRRDGESKGAKGKGEVKRG